MSRLVLMRCGGTEWDAEGRVQGNLDVPLSAEGVEEVRRGAVELRRLEVSKVYASGDEASRETARIVGEALSKPVKVVRELAEVHMGLWQGMLVGELKKSHPKAYNRWLRYPLSVCPPGGEGLLEASERLKRAVRGLAKHSNGAFAVVSPPIASAVLRCALKSIELGRVWEVLSRSPLWEVCEFRAPD